MSASKFLIVLLKYGKVIMITKRLKKLLWRSGLLKRRTGQDREKWWLKKDLSTRYDNAACNVRN